MKKLGLYCLLCLGMWALAAGEVSAQDMKLVSGRIVNKNTKKPFGQEAVFIYAFNTVAEAEDARKVIDSKNGFFESSSMEAASADGYYQITVPETGALIFKVGVVDCVLEKVNYRLEINVEIESNEILKQVDVVGMRQGIQPMDPDNAEIDGNSFRARNKIPIPAQYGKSNARLILQPYLLDGNTGDTVRFLDPMVYDGEQYHLTQERRMGYDTGKDPLMHYVRHEPLVADGMVVDWADTVYLDDPMKSYCVKGVLLLEDYNRVYHREEYLLASARIRRPLKFLEYTLGERQLDPNKYKERPRRERRNTAGNISLTFMVGKAQLDPKDTMNRVQVDKLKSDLLAIVEGEGSQLKEFHIRGVASPDGSYASNLALAKKRVQFAQEQITSVLPRRVLARVYQNPKAEVAPWTAVADLLFADSLKQEAADIRAIVEKYPDSRDRQTNQIRKLPYYKETVVDYLPRLRTVHYEYIHEIYRELTPQEILDRYEHDADYRSGRKKFALYEYWNLFQLVKDPKELEALYKRAYEESKEMNAKPWVLAANNLAAVYLKRKQVDTTLLAPFIDTKNLKGCNISVKQPDGSTVILNPEEVVANQLCMYLLANNFRSASILAQLLPNTEKNRELKALTMCLGGYYKGGETPEARAKAREVFDVVKETTPVNKVVMYLALNTQANDVFAEQAMADLPEDDPLTWYLWAIINSRKSMVPAYALDMYELKAEEWLVKCFKADPKYMDIAAADGDILESIFKSAKSTYEYELNQ